MSDREFQEVFKVGDLPTGRCKVAEIGGRKIAVYHVEDGFYATDNMCPHRGGPLAEGDLIGREIVCPWHLWSFDIETGVNPGSPEGSEIRVCTHHVRVEGDSVLVQVSDEEPEIA